jgi:hypothetical protein
VPPPGKILHGLARCQLMYNVQYLIYMLSSVAESHHFYAAPAPGKNFDAAPAAPAPTLFYSKAKFIKRS